MTPRWPIELVKERLPDVCIKRPDGTHCLGHIRGRLNQFATVCTDNGGEIEVAWETLSHILSTSGTLKL